MAGLAKRPKLVQILLIALVAVALALLLSDRDEPTPPTEDARVVTEQRTRLESEQHARGLVEAGTPR